MSNLMVTDLSLVMDVPPNLSKSIDICYLIFSKFPHDIIIYASQQHNASYEVLLFSRSHKLHGLFYARSCSLSWVLS